MSLKKSGISSKTAKGIMLGAGTIYKNLEYSTTTKKWSGQVFGATSGGAKYTHNVEFLNVEVDGATVKTKGLTHKVGETATLSVNAVELNTDVLQMAIVGKKGTSTVDGYDLVEPKSTVETGDYINNLAYVGFMADGKPIIIIMANALCISGFEFQGQNKDKAVFPLEFECYADDSVTVDQDKLPVKIYYPTV